MRPNHGAPPARQSFIRVRDHDSTYQVDDTPTVRTAAPTFAEADAESFFDVLANDHLNLTVNLLHLRRIAAEEPEHALARAASQIVHSRAQNLSDVQSALEAIVDLAHDPRMLNLLAKGRALPVYMKGIYLWCEAIIDAFEELVTAARQRDLDWSSLRWRLLESSHFYFDGLADPIREDLHELCLDESNPDEPLRNLREHIEELFWTASWMHKSFATGLGP